MFHEGCDWAVAGECDFCGHRTNPDNLLTSGGRNFCDEECMEAYRRERSREEGRKKSEERWDGIKRLAARLGCHNPHFLCDPLLTMMGEPSLSTEFLEKWLLKTHKLMADSEESIRDCLERHCGKEWADLAESLI